MMVFLHNRFVPAELAKVSVFDRGYLLGDGLFETLRVCGGRPFCWEPHLLRMKRGAALLGLQLPYSDRELAGFAAELIRLNPLAEAVLRLTLTRDAGPRGYSFKGVGQARLVMTLQVAPAFDPAQPPCWRLATSTYRVAAGDALAGCKSTSRLLNVLARAEAESRGADEAILLNTRDEVVEAAGANLFCLERGEVATPFLESGALPGITRAVVLEICAKAGIAAKERSVRLPDLLRAEGVFLTLSTLGVVEAVSLDDTALSRSPLTARIREAYWQRVETFRAAR